MDNHDETKRIMEERIEDRREDRMDGGGSNRMKNQYRTEEVDRLHRG